MSEHPLHVQVAEALGFTDLLQDAHGQWWGREPHAGLRITVPNYDRSWCSAGVLLERFKFGVRHGHRALTAPDEDWVAIPHDFSLAPAYGKTPCEALAKLIVQLKKEGKLPND